VQDTAVVPVLSNITIAPAGSATDPLEPLAVSVANVPLGANPAIEALTAAVTHWAPVTSMMIGLPPAQPHRWYRRHCNGDHKRLCLRGHGQK